MGTILRQKWINRPNSSVVIALSLLYLEPGGGPLMSVSKQFDWLWSCDWFDEAEFDHGKPIRFQQILKADEWAKLQDLVELPGEARFAIDACIGLYRLTAADGKSVGASRASLLKLERLCDELKRPLSTMEMILNDDKLWEAIAVGPPGYIRTPDARLRELKAPFREAYKACRKVAAACLLDVYERAAPDVPGGPRRYGNLEALVRVLDHVLAHYTGKRITRKKGKPRDFAYVVCKIAAEPYSTKSREGLKDETINGAIREVFGTPRRRHRRLIG
jgi:hypothetical protein